MKKVILLIGLLFIEIICVRAEDELPINNENPYIKYVDNPGYTIDITAQTGSAGSMLEMIVQGITEDGEYRVLFTNEKKTIVPETTTNGCSYIDQHYSDMSKFKSINYPSTNKISITNDWYIIDGYTNAYILRRYQNENDKYICEILKEPIVLEKPELPAYGSRFHTYVFGNSDTINSFPYFPYGSELGNHKLNIKIGLINDDSIIRKFAKQQSDAYISLIEYAKNTNGTNLSFLDSERNNALNNLTIENGKYYFIYTIYENADSLYRNIDDVAIVMGKNNMLINEVEYANYDQTDPLWESFVDKFKNNTNLKSWAENANYTLDIAYTDDSLTVTTIGKDEEGNDINNTTNFTYQNGIVSHVAATSDFGKEIDGIFILPVAIESFSTVKSYNLDEVYTWLEEHQNATVANDGIEYKTISVENNEPVITTSFNGLISELKMDLRNGIKNFNKIEPTTTKTKDIVENPNTGNEIKIGLLSILTIAGIVGYYITEKKNKFPQT